MHSLFLTSLLAAVSVIAAPATTQSSNSSQNGFASGWYESWDTSLSPSAISWTKLSSVTFAFAVPTNNVSVINVEPPTLLTSLVQEAHSNGVDVILSIGGFSDSAYFSPAVNPQNASTFVQTVLALVSQYQVDGIEFDWEFPVTQPSGGCNVVSPNDTANYLAFLQLMRQDPVGSSITLTAAVGLKPWVDATGSPMTDVSAFASLLDYISVMNYDLYGAWSSTAGPNSAINDTCAPAADQQGSAVSGINAWTKANFPASQIVLGVPAYAHSFSVAPSAAVTASGALALYPPVNKSNQPLGPSDPPAGSPTTLDQCGNPVTPGGTFNFKSLIADGYLTANGTSAPGLDYLYDPCSETPYVYNASSQVLMAYDDATSFAAKGKFIKENNLKGYNVWPLSGDSDDILVDAINGAMGFEPNCPF